MVIYCDGADLASMQKYADDQRVAGFTTNPSLMRKSGITDYRSFAKTVLSIVGDKAVSFEVLSDDWREMEQQAAEIASWGTNIYVKWPITNTKGELASFIPDCPVNVTAVMTNKQIKFLSRWKHQKMIVSIFAGRIADTGKNPVETMKYAREVLDLDTKILWASPREVLNYYQAESCADIITMSPELIEKLSLRWKDLSQYSLETVQQFHNDGKGITF